MSFINTVDDEDINNIDEGIDTIDEGIDTIEEALDNVEGTSDIVEGYSDIVEGYLDTVEESVKEGLNREYLNSNLSNFLDNYSNNDLYIDTSDRLLKHDGRFMLLTDKLLEVDWLNNLKDLSLTTTTTEESGLKKVNLTIDTTAARELLYSTEDLITTSEVPRTGEASVYQDEQLRVIIDSLLTSGEITIISPEFTTDSSLDPVNLNNLNDHKVLNDPDSLEGTKPQPIPLDLWWDIPTKPTDPEFLKLWEKDFLVKKYWVSRLIPSDSDWTELHISLTTDSLTTDSLSGKLEINVDDDNNNNKVDKDDKQGVNTNKVNTDINKGVGDLDNLDEGDLANLFNNPEEFKYHSVESNKGVGNLHNLDEGDLERLFGGDIKRSSIPGFTELFNGVGLSMLKGLVNRLNKALVKEDNKDIQNITQMSNLVWINLSNSNLTGTIPDMQNLTSLEILDLSNNELVGEVPYLPRNIQRLNVSRNSLTTLHPNVFSTYSIDVSYNQISGSLMKGSVHQMYANNNYFKGNLPLYNNAETIDVRNNSLDGTMIIYGGNGTYKTSGNMFSSSQCISFVRGDVSVTCIIGADVINANEYIAYYIVSFITAFMCVCIACVYKVKRRYLSCLLASCFSLISLFFSMIYSINDFVLMFVLIQIVSASMNIILSLRGFKWDMGSYWLEWDYLRIEAVLATSAITRSRTNNRGGNKTNPKLNIWLSHTVQLWLQYDYLYVITYGILPVFLGLVQSFII